MPSTETDPRYEASEIYCICSSETDKIYIGSTYVGREKRMKIHRRPCNNCKSREVMEHGNYDITRICFFPCNNKTELDCEEGRWIRKFREAGYEVVNQLMPGAIAAAGGEGAYNKQQKTTHAERNSVKQKEWHEKNKEKVAAQTKQYREANKEAIAERAKNAPKFLCECCGSSFFKKGLNRHKTSAKYQQNMASKV